MEDNEKDRAEKMFIAESNIVREMLLRRREKNQQHKEKVLEHLRSPKRNSDESSDTHGKEEQKENIIPAAYSQEAMDCEDIKDEELKEEECKPMSEKDGTDTESSNSGTEGFRNGQRKDFTSLSDRGNKMEDNQKDSSEKKIISQDEILRRKLRAEQNYQEVKRKWFAHTRNRRKRNSDEPSDTRGKKEKKEHILPASSDSETDNGEDGPEEASDLSQSESDEDTDDENEPKKPSKDKVQEPKPTEEEESASPFITTHLPNYPPVTKEQEAEMNIKWRKRICRVFWHTEVPIEDPRYDEDTVLIRQCLISAHLLEYIIAWSTMSYPSPDFLVKALCTTESVKIFHSWARLEKGKTVWSGSVAYFYDLRGMERAAKRATRKFKDIRVMWLPNFVDLLIMAERSHKLCGEGATKVIVKGPRTFTPDEECDFKEKMEVIGKVRSIRFAKEERLTFGKIAKVYFHFATHAFVAKFLNNGMKYPKLGYLRVEIIETKKERDLRDFVINKLTEYYATKH